MEVGTFINKGSYPIVSGCLVDRAVKQKMTFIFNEFSINGRFHMFVLLASHLQNDLFQHVKEEY